MQLGKIKGVGDLLSNHPLGNDLLWSIDANKLTGTDICLFYARAGLEQKFVAATLIRKVQNHLITSGYSGDLSEAPQALLLHEPPDEPFYLDEFVEGINKLSSQAGMATIFSLETKIEPSMVTKLTWKQSVKLQGLNQISMEILHKAALRRHSRLPHVFWEKISPSVYAPLFELENDIETAFGFSWVSLLYRYESMMPVCRDSEADYFRSLMM